MLRLQTTFWFEFKRLLIGKEGKKHHMTSSIHIDYDVQKHLHLFIDVEVNKTIVKKIKYAWKI